MGSAAFPTAPGAAWDGANFFFPFWVLRKQAGYFGVYSLLLCGLPRSTLEGISAALCFDGLYEQREENLVAGFYDSPGAVSHPVQTSPSLRIPQIPPEFPLKGGQHLFQVTAPCLQIILPTSHTPRICSQDN